MTRIVDALLALLFLLGFALLMALRHEPSQLASRIALAVTAGACLGATLLFAQRARRGRRAR